MPSEPVGSPPPMPSGACASGLLYSAIAMPSCRPSSGALYARNPPMAPAHCGGETSESALAPSGACPVRVLRAASAANSTTGTPSRPATASTSALDRPATASAESPTVSVSRPSRKRYAQPAAAPAAMAPLTSAPRKGSVATALAAPTSAASRSRVILSSRYSSSPCAVTSGFSGRVPPKGCSSASSIWYASLARTYVAASRLSFATSARTAAGFRPGSRYMLCPTLLSGRRSTSYA
mmetsp:Transcript_28845/g.68019  ORF Transcript_28845/g.68019 Transcript_28845/m.68019 type:complete len:237 (+) Transcript_28845:878-1588(+)